MQALRDMLVGSLARSRCCSSSVGHERGWCDWCAVLLEGRARGLLGLDDMEQAVMELARVIWLSPDIVADILKKGREVGR